MPVRMLPTIPSAWPPELTPPGQAGAERRRGDVKRQALERYAAKMRLHRTPSTRGTPDPPPPAEYVPPRIPTPHGRFLMLRQCFVCHAWVWCVHREPDLIDVYRQRGGRP